jgi:hypothetical protein
VARRRIVGLSPEDYLTLRNFLGRLKRTPGVGLRNSASWTNPEDHQAPEVYMARTKETIPALLDDVGTGSVSSVVPGGGIVSVWSMSDEELVDTERDIYALNLSGFPIPSGTWVNLIRDKFGKWFIYALDNEPVYARFRIGNGVVQPEDVGTGTGTGTGTVADSGDIIAFFQTAGWVYCDRLDDANEIIETNIPVYGNYIQSVYITGMVVWAVRVNGLWQIRDEGKRIWSSARVVASYGAECLVDLEPSSSLFGGGSGGISGPQVLARPSAPTGATVLVMYSNENSHVTSSDVNFMGTSLFTIVSVLTCATYDLGTGTGTSP